MIGAIGQWLTNRASVQHRIATLQREIVALQIDNKRLREARDFNRARVVEALEKAEIAGIEFHNELVRNSALMVEIDRLRSLVANTKKDNLNGTA